VLAAANFDNIAMFDVLHHLKRPRRFFQEAERVLDQRGRVVMIFHSIETSIRIRCPHEQVAVTTPTIWQQTGVVAVQFRCAPA